MKKRKKWVIKKKNQVKWFDRFNWLGEKLRPGEANSMEQVEEVRDEIPREVLKDIEESTFKFPHSAFDFINDPDPEVRGFRVIFMPPGYPAFFLGGGDSISDWLEHTFCGLSEDQKEQIASFIHRIAYDKAMKKIRAKRKAERHKRIYGNGWFSQI
ncbi:hypothetical protein S922_14065 [Salmonella enterica subsp. enterica]|nr:hypothetical protein [Salmonella enterica subsp. enterica]EAW9773104.1 hypothetical protein [Salmonella enterica]